ncbi:MAG: alpha/beta hydrolase-fold protein [Deltaproteobacteria bacterium]|nr:alpha/beta hydrolase-fold protein [Deltaproteobacteria bacterium]
MPLHPYEAPRGRRLTFTVDSEALKGNLLGDPHRRRVEVYLPAEAEGARELPLLVDLVGYTGSGPKHLAWSAYAESVPQRVDRLIDEGKLGPVAVAFPDCFTRLGGNQYIDSLALGAWERFLCEEMLEVLEAALPLGRGPEHRALFGKSSGGYGAIVHGMRHADTWGAVACHSGDMAFELCYLGDFPAILDALAREPEGIVGFLRRFEEARKVSGKDFHILMGLAMAATYDPDPQAPFGVRLPVTEDTCELIPARWEQWLRHDPVRMIEEEAVEANLRALKGLYVDCGSRDQYKLHYGARRLKQRLDALGIEHRYETFEDDHSGIDYRMDVSLPFLYERLRG